MDWNIFLLVNRTRVEWETVSSPDLVNLINRLSESPKRKTAKILHLQVQQMKVPKYYQNPPSFCFYCKEPRHWKRDFYKSTDGKSKEEKFIEIFTRDSFPLSLKHINTKYIKVNDLL